MNTETIFCVMTVKQQTTKHHNDSIYKLELVSTDNEIAITYIDPHNDNFENWQHICERPYKGFFIKNLTEATYTLKNGDTLIDADSDVEIWHESSDRQKVFDALEEMTRPAKDKIFSDLFGI